MDLATLAYNELIHDPDLIDSALYEILAEELADAGVAIGASSGVIDSAIIEGREEAEADWAEAEAFHLAESIHHDRDIR